MSDAVAMRCLGLSPAQVRQFCREVPEHQATYYWQPIRGGGNLIVGDDGTALFANSSVGFEAHLETFLGGRRTDAAGLAHLEQLNRDGSWDDATGR